MQTPKKGIAVDASTIGGNPGLTECRGVDIETGMVIFSEQIGLATNNIGEWLAIAYGAEYICRNKLDTTLFSDSQICILWYKKKVCKTNIFTDYPEIAAKNNKLIPLLEEASDIVMVCNVKIDFWNRRQFGENPADYGRK